MCEFFFPCNCKCNLKGKSTFLDVDLANPPAEGQSSNPNHRFAVHKVKLY